MITNNLIIGMLSAPLGPDWTVDWLAEQVLAAIASQEPEDGRESDQLVLDADAISDRQSRRLIRPLLACLAQKSAAEEGTAPNLYEGRLTFKRQNRSGPVWVVGEFKNTPGRVFIALRRSNSPTHRHQSTINHVAVVPHADAQPGNSAPTSTSVPDA